MSLVSAGGDTGLVLTNQTDEVTTAFHTKPTFAEPTRERQEDHSHSDKKETDAETYVEDDPDIFYFESDHVALKGNNDYHNLLKTIAVLQAQRIQALNDLDTLHQCRTEALKDPIAFVDKLQQNKNFGFPLPQSVAVLPSIDWEKYTRNVDFSSLGIHKHMTRLKCQLLEGTGGTNMNNFYLKHLETHLSNGIIFKKQINI